MISTLTLAYIQAKYKHKFIGLYVTTGFFDFCFLFLLGDVTFNLIKTL